MPKEFSEWLGAMANSIEDASIVDRFAGDTLNELQTRMCLANMLVPVILNEDDVADWLSAFAVELNDNPIGRRYVTEGKLTHIIGPIYVKQYVDTTGDKDTVEWLIELKRVIKNGTLRRA